MTTRSYRNLLRRLTGREEEEEVVIPTIGAAERSALPDALTIDDEDTILLSHMDVTTVLPCEQGLVVSTGENRYKLLRNSPYMKHNQEFLGKDFPKITHDAKALYLWGWQHGLDIQGVVFDTMLAAYCLDPTQSDYDVHTLAGQYFDRAPTYRKEAEFALYNAFVDAHVVTHLMPKLVQDLQFARVDSLFSEIELPVARVLARMEYDGIAINEGHLHQLSAQIKEFVKPLEDKVFSLAGCEFNIGSPKQLQQILYTRLKLPKGRKNQQGFSTDSEHLRSLLDKHEIVAPILEWRQRTKLVSTYTDALPKLVNKTTGRVHTSFNQAVTATGRLSSSGPNLQNIPVRSADGKAVRKGFVPCRPDWVLLAADYSQIELRVLAHYAKDETMIAAFEHGDDLHGATACKIFGVEPQDVTREMRRLAKIVNFSIPYGTTARGLSAQVGCTVEYAEELRQSYLDQFPAVRTYMADMIRTARETGWVTTLLGRRRPIPDITSGNLAVRGHAEREAINTPIQGTAADIMKLALINVREGLNKHTKECGDMWGTEPEARLLLQVHDEVVLEVRNDEYALSNVAAIVQKAMQSAYKLCVPIEVELKVGPSWGDMAPY